MHRIIVTGKNKDMSPPLGGMSKSSAVVRCLPAAETGRFVSFGAGRPISSGVQPAARAAGDLPCFQGPRTRTVLRSVPKPSASHSPALECPPDAAPGTFTARMNDVATTLAGLAVFGAIAWFFLVLA